MAERLALQVLLAGASGLLLPFCFPDEHLFPLAWVALIPLHLAVERARPKRAFFVSWFAGTLAFLGIMVWVVTAMHVYGKVPLLPSYGVLLLFSLYLGLYVAFYGWGIARVAQGNPGLMWLAAPSLWVLLELVRTYFLTGIPWALLAYSQTTWLPIIQIADLTGVYGLSWLIVLGNVGVLTIVRLFSKRGRQLLGGSAWVAPVMAGFALVGAWTYGMQMLDGPTALVESKQPAAGGDDPRSITVGLVQANIDQGQKWDERFRQETMDRYLRLTRTAGQAVDLIIWPEAATPFVYEMEGAYQKTVSGLAQQLDTPLLFGSPAVRRYPDGRPYLLNSAYLLSPVGNIVGRYDKQHLVPFGEYIPFHHSLLFFLDKLVEGIGDFEAGTDATVLAVPQRIPRPSEVPGRPVPMEKGAFGVVICYEVIFPELVRQFAQQGADFMVTITNDAWFGHSAAPYQHFGMVVFRAVENRRAFARAANTGVSGFIDPYGRVIQASPIFTEQAMTGSLPLVRTKTFYTEHGDLFAYACVIIAGLCLLMSRPQSPAARRGW